MPSVAVTIPTLLGGPMLDLCLRALSRQTFRDFEVLVVDNGGVAGQVDAKGLGFPVRVLTPEKNVGFGAAVNLAVKATDARLIATLNDDTEPEPEWLEALFRELECGPRIGMCASSIRHFAPRETNAPPERLDSAGMLICLDGSSKQRGGSMPPGAFAASADVLLPSACAALYRREMLDEVGLFDEDFFLYCEDTDLGLRARWAGWGCRYAAAAVVRHHYSATARPFSPMKAHFVERNRIWVAIKNFPLVLLPAVPLAALLRYLWQLRAVQQQRGAAGQFVKSGESVQGAFAIVVRAWLETVIHLPALLRKRALGRGTRKIGTLEFMRLLYSHRITAKDLAFS
ncbi:MAG TPA: glycosyltransferase family 2 protein [Bryobacteraceae bacterium]|jgi:GT2 family glycosyltransferase|nr:glycosyltransferase family 2 protein [Bryobacteraceae bacterium]